VKFKAGERVRIVNGTFMVGDLFYASQMAAQIGYIDIISLAFEKNGQPIYRLTKEKHWLWAEQWLERVADNTVLSSDLIERL